MIHRELTCRHRRRGKQEGQIRSVALTYTLLCVKYIVSGKLVLSSVLCGDLEGWDGGEVEGDSRGRGYLYTHT